MTVDGDHEPHSIRAYFIRRGDHAEPVRYEVDRIRNGRSFVTRRVVARQAIGAILNAESSFQRPERAAHVQTVRMPDVPAAASLDRDTWISSFDRATVPAGAVGGAPRDGAGRIVCWMRVAEPLGDASEPASQLIHRCWLAYLSDDMPTESVMRAHPGGERDHDSLFTASLDHTIWFHHRLRADDWHLYDFSCHHLGGGRGTSIGHVFSADGTHLATVAQEVLLRDARES